MGSPDPSGQTVTLSKQISSIYPRRSQIPALKLQRRDSAQVLLEPIELLWKLSADVSELHEDVLLTFFVWEHLRGLGGDSSVPGGSCYLSERRRHLSVDLGEFHE
jgi:hypothetical protein